MTVPIHATRGAVVSAVREGMRVPPVPWHIGGRTRLEDYALEPDHPGALEPAEWEGVLRAGREVLDRLRMRAREAVGRPTVRI